MDSLFPSHIWAVLLPTLYAQTLSVTLIACVMCVFLCVSSGFDNVHGEKMIPNPKKKNREFVPHTAPHNTQLTHKEKMSFLFVSPVFFCRFGFVSHWQLHTHPNTTHTKKKNNRLLEFLMLRPGTRCLH